VGEELVGGRALRAETTAGDRRGGISLDGGDLFVFDEDELAAADAAIGTDRAGDADAGIVDAGAESAGPGGLGFAAGSITAVEELAHERPATKEISERHG
jgi:hypothetical protein